ncbi:hypothetical protein C1752_07894 [Acaryochloris thomasi RCC1774]|uniref:Outer membrane protein beta-barrel domain-containing protein n=1 Tax=Acaryochloris thomasi RCC1774 TaxID=1764569 RepID=A0A2W1JB31_9CYAN|nr:hypothetical protein [Acaryochloris thomasi]PZD71166.1 hypothetical protein C1752_07894 [Acaryochloris thomasi RCC1774]
MKTRRLSWMKYSLACVGIVGASLIAQAALASEPVPSAESLSQQAQSLQLQEDGVVSQAPLEEAQPFQATRSGPSYIGIGGNFGGFGGTSVGEDGLIIYSKIGLTEFFSVRPAVVTDFEDDATFLLPATFDFAPIKAGKIGQSQVLFAPYLGGGMAVTTDGDFGPMVTGGVDLPLNRNLTATTGVHAGFIDDTDFGVFLGIGYNLNR